MHTTIFNNLIVLYACTVHERVYNMYTKCVTYIQVADNILMVYRQRQLKPHELKHDTYVKRKHYLTYCLTQKR